MAAPHAERSYAADEAMEQVGQTMNYGSWHPLQPCTPCDSAAEASRLLWRQLVGIASTWSMNPSPKRTEQQ